LKQHKLIEINFEGNADGSKLTMKEPFALIQGKRLKILKILKEFYANQNIVVEAISSTFPSLTVNQYKVATNNVKIPKSSLGWFIETTNGMQYFNLVVNNNLLFNQDTTKTYNNVINDLDIELETDIIETFDIFIRVRHYVDYTNQSSLFYPYVNIKIIAELL